MRIRQPERCKGSHAKPPPSSTTPGLDHKSALRILKGLLGYDREIREGRKEMHHVENLNHSHLPATCLEIVLHSLRVLLESNPIHDG
jgi:hypothetical protein